MISRRFILPLLLLLIGSSVLFGQGVEIKSESRLRLEAQGEANGWIWFAPPSLTVEQRGQVLLVEGPPGKYRVQVTSLTMDYEAKTFTMESGFIDIVLGGKPTPPGPGPGPVDPTLPDDEFGFGAAATSWLSTVKPEYLGYAVQLGANLRTAGKQLESGEIAEINTALSQVADNNQKILVTGSEQSAAWKEFNSSFNKKLNEHWPLDKSQTVAMLYNVAAVLGGVQ